MSYGSKIWTGIGVNIAGTISSLLVALPLAYLGGWFYANLTPAPHYLQTAQAIGYIMGCLSLFIAGTPVAMRIITGSFIPEKWGEAYVKISGLYLGWLLFSALVDQYESGWLVLIVVGLFTLTPYQVHILLPYKKSK